MTIGRSALLTVALLAVPLAAPALAKDEATQAVIDVGKALKRGLDTTAKAVDKAVIETIAPAAKPAKKRSAKKVEPGKEVSKKADAKAAEPDKQPTKPEIAKGAPEPGKPVGKKEAESVKAGTAANDTKPAGTKAKAAFPTTVEEAKAAAEAATKPPETWSEQEITAAKASCADILKRINAVAIQEAPIREGACGTPAPIQIISIGKNPEVSISPPATVTCDLAENLAKWLESDLQPLAKKHLGSEIIKIESMSSYSCRNAYGRAKNKLSEHGIANALDIRGFVTASAKTAMVLEDWGTPQREILARIAAEKAAAEKLAAEKAAAEKAAQANQIADKSKAPAVTPPSATGSTVGAPAAGLARTTIVDGIPKVTVTLPGGTSDDRTRSDGMALTEPSKLGGPTRAAIVDIQIAVPGKGNKSAESQRKFLHEAHTAACRIFGTTLGPEANAAHRNHFHVDMAKRKSVTTKICD